MTNIAEGLAQLTVDADAPVLHPQNYRRGDVEVIAASLRRFGQVRPIVVQASTGHVVAGNHTLKAVRELGWEQVAAVYVDMPDEEAEAYLVADNRTSDKAVNDDAALASILERLMLSGRLEGVGYTPDEVDDMLSSLDQLPEVEPEFEGQDTSEADQRLEERFAAREHQPMRQFVLMYDQRTATEVEGYFRRLERAWGVTQTRDVVLEALRRAAAEPPVEGLTAEEAALANAEPEPWHDPSDPDDAERAAALGQQLEGDDLT